MFATAWHCWRFPLSLVGWSMTKLDFQFHWKTVFYMPYLLYLSRLWQAALGWNYHIVSLFRCHCRRIQLSPSSSSFQEVWLFEQPRTNAHPLVPCFSYAIVHWRDQYVIISCFIHISTCLESRRAIWMAFKSITSIYIPSLTVPKVTLVASLGITKNSTYFHGYPFCNFVAVVFTTCVHVSYARCFRSFNWQLTCLCYETLFDQNRTYSSVQKN